MFTLFDIPFTVWGILLAVVANFVLGFLWYGPVFGDYWMKLNGFKKEDLKMSAVDGFTSFMNALVIGAVLNIFIHFTDVAINREISIWLTALLVSVLTFIGFTVTSALNLVIYESRDVMLFLLNVGYHLIAYILAGLLIAVFLG